MKPVRMWATRIQLAKYTSTGFLAGVGRGLRVTNCGCKASLAAPSQTSLRPLTSQRDGHNNPDLDITFDISDLFKYLSNEQAKLSISKFLQTLRATGLRETDPRLKEMMANLNNVQSDLIDLDTAHKVYIDRETFKECITDNIVLIVKAFRNQFIIPEFLQFTQRINELFWRAKANTQGELASYIPQLARFNPESWGLAICTVDGQRYAIGDAHDPFCMQSIIKPLTYAMVLDELGPDVVHQYVGQEPSGQAFNNISLDSMNRPHNPMINAGAVVTCSLLKQGMNIADKFEYEEDMGSYEVVGESTQAEGQEQGCSG